jgi:TolB-like protein
MDENEQLWILAGLAGFTVVLALVVRNLIRGRPGPIPQEGPLRLQVRPLRELRPDPSHLYLGNTISREIVASLKSFERLEPALGDTPASLTLEGTVQKTGPRIVLAIQLLSGRHPLWRATHDGAMNDLPRMQADIAMNVARALRVTPRKVQAAERQPAP